MPDQHPVPAVTLNRLSIYLRCLRRLREQGVRRVSSQRLARRYRLSAAQIRKDLSAMVLYGAARFPIADTYLTQFYHSRSIVGTPTAVTNFSHCGMADADIDGARKETDPKTQAMLWAAAQRKLMQNVCSIPLFEQLQVWARRKSVDYGYTIEGALSLGEQRTEASSAR